MSSTRHIEYDYLEEPEEELSCAICTDAFVAPVRIQPCEHVFCAECIRQSMERSPVCPYCRGDVYEGSVVPDRKLQEQVDALAVRCPAAPECRWEGARGLMAGHVGQECGVVELACGEEVAFTGCPVSLPRGKLQEHQETCSFRRLVCRMQCGAWMGVGDMVRMEEHERASCPEREVACLTCGTRTTRIARESTEGIPLGEIHGDSGIAMSFSPPMAPVANVRSLTSNNPFLRHGGDGMGARPSSTPPFQTHVAGRGMGRTILSTSGGRMQAHAPREHPLRAGDLRAHMEQECPAVIIPCPQRYILGERGGCPARIARADLRRHSEEECAWYRVRGPLRAVELELRGFEARIEELTRASELKQDRLARVTLHASDVDMVGGPYTVQAAMRQRTPPGVQIKTLRLRRFLPGPLWTMTCETLFGREEQMGNPAQRGSLLNPIIAAGPPPPPARWEDPFGPEEDEEGMLEVLDLRGSAIGMAGGVVLGSTLRGISSLRSITLRGNRIGPNGVKAIADGLILHTNLTHLDLSRSRLQDGGMQHVAQSLSALTSLRYLDFGENGLSSGAAMGIGEILDAVPLEVLILSGNPIYPQGYRVIGVALGRSTSLKTLRLSQCRLGPAAMGFLAAGICAQRALETVDLGQTEFCDDSANILAQAILNRPYPPGMIDISGHRLSPQGIATLHAVVATAPRPPRFTGIPQVFEQDRENGRVSYPPPTASPIHRPLSWGYGRGGSTSMAGPSLAESLSGLAITPLPLPDPVVGIGSPIGGNISSDDDDDHPLSLVYASPRIVS